MTTEVKPQDKTVNANGLNIHYLDWGNPTATPMVLLHGLRGHAHSWDDISAAFCQDFHVMALDQRGRGETDWAKDGNYTTEAYVADLEGFCGALGLDSFVLVGHSMGGRNSLFSPAAAWPRFRNWSWWTWARTWTPEAASALPENWWKSPMGSIHSRKCSNT